MEVTTKEMITVKNRLINLMTTIYFINHQERERERERARQHFKEIST